MFNVALYEPEIPPNTGNIIRLCANTGCTLHLVEPLGFDVDDKSLRRAGLDYHEYAKMQVHPDLSALRSAQRGRLHAFTTKGRVSHTDITFHEDDLLLFGPESRGLPQELLDELSHDQKVRLPMVTGSRSLNLANTVAVVVYEAWRQLGFRGSE